jgi:hypothetical protein
MQVLHLQPFVPQLRLPPRLVVYLQNSPGESHSNGLQHDYFWAILQEKEIGVEMLQHILFIIFIII